jgi:hypothetical protein
MDIDEVTIPTNKNNTVVAMQAIMEKGWTTKAVKWLP